MRNFVGSVLLTAGLIAGGVGAQQVRTPKDKEQTDIAQLPRDTVVDTPKTDVLFTIDDGPSKYTLAIAKTLDSLGYKGIFFLVGEGITSKNRADLIEVLTMGHTLGNHSYSHPNFAKLGLQRAERQIIGTDTLLSSLMAEAGVQQQKYFRYPYGVKIHKEYRKEFQSFLDSLGYAKPMYRHMDRGLYDRSHKAQNSNIASIKIGDTIVIHERSWAVDEIIQIADSLDKKRAKTRSD